MLEDRPIPQQDELPSQFADRMGLHYASCVTKDHKKENGQFFTPLAITRLMASFASNVNGVIRILDPGCGTTSLSCALVEYLASQSPTLDIVELVAYETDVSLISYSEEVLTYLKNWLLEQHITLNYILHIQDFILDNAQALKDDSALFINTIEPFDYVITNPPYFKLSKDDLRVKVSKKVVSGQPNMYSLFIAIAASLLKEDGELIFITPRSFSSGSYFKAFREFFFKRIQLERIHLFVSRKDTFNRDKVLQETVIIKGVFKNIIDDEKQVLVSSSQGLKDIDTPSLKYFASKELIDHNTKEKVLHLPIDDNEELILNLIKDWDGNLNKYNIQISTGPVVAFRSKDFIQNYYENSTVYLAPLFWLHNVNKMSLDREICKPDKGRYVRIQDGSRPILIPNKDYVLLRRFSTKDDKSRLIAAPYFCDATHAQYIGVENKVNYIYRPKGHLDRNEILGLCTLLNSELFDTYFGIFNGNVNVSATELRQMSLPPLENIKEIGDQIILSNDHSMENVNNIVNSFFARSVVLDSHE